MTRAAIESALQSALAAIALPSGVASMDAWTAWRNGPTFTPVTGKPYQRLTFMYAEPDNPVFGAGFIERGYLQIDLFYPIGNGPDDARTRGELLRTTFARGSSFTASGTSVMIDRTPTVSDGISDGDRYRVMVKIRFYANQF